MRLRSFSSVVVVLSFAIAAHGTRAVAQIEFAHSTIRIMSPTEPATLDEPSAAPNPEQSVRQPKVASSNAAASDEPAVPVAHHAPVRAPARHYDVRPANFVAPTTAQPLPHPQLASRSPSLVGVYAGTSARATLGKMPGPAPVQPRPAAQPTRQRGKPFQSVQSEPAISPYMNLYRNEVNANNLPNYFAFVRPQMDQIEANRQQTAELQKLRGQLQNMSSAGSGAPQSARMGASAHYMDTAQFYPGLRR